MLLPFDFVGQRAKVLRQFVTSFYLELCKLSRLVDREKGYQSFELGCRLPRLVSLLQH